MLFVLIVVMATLLTDFSIRKLILVCLALAGVYAGVLVLTLIFPSWENWFTIDTMVETALSSEGYTGKGDLNRLTSIPIILERFLTSFDKKLFGLGLGSCDTSAFAFLNTPFYQKYGYLRYNWFAGAFLVLEMGLAGLAVYYTFFVMVYISAGKMAKRGKCELLYSQMARIMAVVCMLLILYNGSMRIEEAYLVYFVLALPFLRERCSTVKVKNNEERSI